MAKKVRRRDTSARIKASAPHVQKRFWLHATVNEAVEQHLDDSGMSFTSYMRWLIARHLKVKHPLRSAGGVFTKETSQKAHRARWGDRPDEPSRNA